MTFIKTNIPQPGILELLFYKGASGAALSNLAHVLLHGPSGLTPGERELIASYVSYLNGCEFCHKSHSASASVHLNDAAGHTISCIVSGIDDAPVTEKMKHLLRIAAMVTTSGRNVTPELVAAAKSAAASDEDIHDTVLIAAAFCMYNRYVDGLNTTLPADDAEYKQMGQRLANKGYKYPPKLMLGLVRNILRKKPMKLRERKT